MRKHQYADTYFDGELAERTKVLMKKLFVGQLEHIEKLAEDSLINPHEDKLQSEVKMSGVKWLEAYGAKERALAARTRRIGEEVRLLGDLKNHLTDAPILPDPGPGHEENVMADISELLARAKADLPEDTNE